MALPKSEEGLMIKVYKEVFPIVHSELGNWKSKAEQIPNEELRKQALASISSKTFHCEGGSILALAAGESKKEAIRFIVAYQTISDYLDNLCDRSTSLDPDDFAMLHQSMKHALLPGEPMLDYYQLRTDRDDGGYLANLVETCQNVLSKLKHYDKIAPALIELNEYYCDLQIHKHVKWEERVPRLKTWFESLKNRLPQDMTWYEFSACAGSTLGIFCLVSYAFNEEFSEKTAVDIRNAYFPYVQGVHILLDYFIDQEEDREGNDLNFCFYYESEQMMIERLSYFVKKANEDVSMMSDSKFHRMIIQGLIGIYLADSKVGKQKDVDKYTRRLLKEGGFSSSFFYWNSKMYHKLKRMKNK